MAEYRTKDGDTVDLIAYKYYGDQAGAIEALLDANPGLAIAGPVLIAGIVVQLPKLEIKTIKTVKLWG